MKNIFILLAGCLLLAACGSTPENRSNAVANSTNIPAERPAVNTNTVVNANAERQVQGVKIEKPETVHFEAATLPGDWQWIDPDSPSGPTKYEAGSGGFKMTVPTGKDLFGENRTAPRLVKAVTGDFILETRIRFDPKEDYQGAGLLIYTDGDNYLRIERAFGGVGGGMSGMRFDQRKKDEYLTIATPGETPTGAKAAELRLLRIGNTFTAFWREDENTEWKELGEVRSDYPETIQVGLITCNTAAPITAEFEYVRLAPAGK